MSYRRVKKTRKNSEGDITALCNPGEWWSPRQKVDAINDIENGTHAYYVQDNAGSKSDIHVVNGPTGKYLRSDPNGNASDNLNNLPDC